MNAKQQRFVTEYLIDLNATQAAIRCGYSPKTARVQGSRLLLNADIQASVAAGKAHQLGQNDLSASRVLEELRRLAFTDTRGFFDDAGNLKPMQQLSAEQGAALASFEVIIKNAKAGDNQTDTVHKIRLWDKTRALEHLAKHFGLLKETVDVQGGLSLAWDDE